jgi:microcystin-dependent protein
MSEFFIGQIMMSGYNFAPKYFAQCNGQLLAIAQNQALFSLLGTQYGGDGVRTFALPDLRSRTPVGYAGSVDPAWQPPQLPIGLQAGVENVTLLPNNLPQHLHMANASNAAGDNRNPSGRFFGTSTNTGTALNIYGPSTGTAVAMNPASVAPVGGTQPHPNIQPYCTINFCIALSGIFPSRS